MRKLTMMTAAAASVIMLTGCEALVEELVNTLLEDDDYGYYDDGYDDDYDSYDGPSCGGNSNYNANNNNGYDDDGYDDGPSCGGNSSGYDGSGSSVSKSSGLSSSDIKAVLSLHNREEGQSASGISHGTRESPESRRATRSSSPRPALSSTPGGRDSARTSSWAPRATTRPLTA